MQLEEFKKALAAVKQDHRLKDIQRGLLNNNFIRTINYHNTHISDKARFEKEIAWFSKHFSAVNLEDINRFLDTGKWHKDKPGLILAIFEGFRHHYDVMHPLLEKYGMTGWYHIPPFFLDVPVEQQLEFAEAHELHISKPEEYADGRHALTWDEVREIAKNHVMCCHSGTHYEIKLDTSDEDMEREIVQSKKRFEDMAGVPVDVFCWLYGEEYSFNPKAAVHIQNAGYHYVVGNLKIERVIPK